MKQEYIDFIKNEIKLQIVGKNVTSKEHCKFKCLLCGETFMATPKSKVQNFKKSRLPGCPKCTHKSRYGDIDRKNEKRILDMGYVLHESYSGLKEKILVHNSNCECGRKWKTTPEHIFTGKAFCKPCNDENKASRLQDINDIRHEHALKDLPEWEKYQKDVRFLTEKIYREHIKDINPENYVRGKSGQDGAYHLDHIFSIKYCFYNDVPPDICAHKSNLIMLPWRENSVKWKSPTVMIPDIIKPYVSTSALYDTFYSVITDTFNTVVFKRNYRIGGESPYTIPLFSEAHNLGILFIAFDDYLESKLGSKSYLNKVKQSAKNAGINLIIIFEDEWQNKNEIIISKLEHIFGKSTCKTLYARNCFIKEIEGSISSKFLRETHIQGSDISQIKLGAFFNEELVAVMTFCKPRRLMSIANTPGVFELSRFSTHIEYRVTGIASKLLTYFKRNYAWKDIYTYADIRWSDGNLYDKLGMHYVHTSKPNYFYIVNGIRKHRWQYRKSELPKILGEAFDESKTEYQNMLNFGYDRIWDCGNLKYKITKV